MPACETQLALARARETAGDVPGALAPGRGPAPAPRL